MRLFNYIWLAILLLPITVMSQVQDTMGGAPYGTDGTDGTAYGAGWWWFWFVLLLVIVGLAIWWVSSTGGRRPSPGGSGRSGGTK